MKRIILITIAFPLFVSIHAQSVITLENCRNMALENNKEQKISEKEIKIAEYQQKAAFTKYLPELSVKGAYVRNQNKTSLIGEDMFLPIGTRMPDGSFGFTKDDILNPTIETGGMEVPLDENMHPFDPREHPEKIRWKNYTTIPKDELTFDTRNMYIGVLNLTQPIFMGGKIIAYNKIARLNQELALSQQETNKQEIILKTDETYWQIVSLVNKKKAVEGLIRLLDKMERDVKILIETGFATKADELTVLVRKNEAEMALLKVDNGIVLSKMLLAQYCGIPLKEKFTLADENIENIPLLQPLEKINMEEVMDNRDEIKSLTYAQELHKQKEKIVRADLLPNIAFTANYLASNPNIINGFEKKFGFTWNIGVVVNIPLLHWGENIHLLNAAKSETAIAELKLMDTKEKIELQVSQSEFKQSEAFRKLEIAYRNQEKANENLRYATVGFEEGVIPASNLLEAQTAWLTANSDKIDAEIEAKMSEIYLQKATGILGK